ncbi:phosphoenolpyruvate mutase [Ruminococcus albus]|uniref:phosphoenolpyruvate mutase n=1 Tax=Ruminococcus albus (strain ATCC 27210 / DSM 20455 / JCM 14654 / NCDO 2250 / 7) TaxID=697329 RepID=E6UET6_RUMA7|nr:phosphoenolpyruvate mutase [Ruminococcus albus]ADU21855.1 phosphoenolpyruvate phosphomutase [Ruminococcus albus 7 = DSM 20455]
MTLLILDSGRGSRMGGMTDTHPKCMTEISDKETILSRQLSLAASEGLKKVVITTGYLADVLEDYVRSLDMPLDITFVHNDEFDRTNYMWSIYLARHILDDDIILMHGDLVFDSLVLHEVIAHEGSCMAVSSSVPLPEKDFKAVIEDGKIVRVGVEFFDNAEAAQPLYKLTKQDFRTWLDNITAYCESGIDEKRTCYAEKALNEVSGECDIRPLDVDELLCSEIDNADDLEKVSRKLDSIKHRNVYMCFSTDIIHNGHISIIKKAAELGRLTVGVLSDEAVAGYKRFPLLPFEERRTMFENISGVDCVVGQQELSYRENIMRLRPDIVVHGDDWRTGVQKPIREETISLLAEYGGRLVEYPYSYDEKYIGLERRSLAELSTPGIRRSRLKKMLGIKGLITAMEAHSGLTGLIVENTSVCENGGIKQFDAMWISSLCDSTARGKPDIELVDMTSRYRTVDEIMEVTAKPIIFDGDTGGIAEHFVYTVRTLERMGVSMVIIEDKTGLKKNSLFGNEVVQTQADIKDFCAKISAGKRAQKTSDFMICARIESLILEKGVEDALERAFAYTEAGADAIMIHSRKKDPAEVFEFVERFRAQDADTPIVVVPTAFDSVTEEEFKARGVNIVIYANQLTRSGFPAMKKAAEMILKNHRAQECDEICMPFGEIIRLIPDDIKEDNYGR